MSTDHIRYDLLVREALRGVVRRVVNDAARHGLPGDHHFYILFNTQTPGVRISPRLHEKYPEEMTIVLQHQFWDLAATDAGIEVGLSFGGVPEKLFVPYEALKGFFDPSVQFGLEFEVSGEKAKTGEDAPAAAPAPVTVPAAPPPPMAETSAAKPERAAKAATPASEEAEEKKTDGKKEKRRPQDGAEVVRLDRFRKK